MHFCYHRIHEWVVNVKVNLWCQAMRVFVWYLCLQLRLHRLYYIAFVPEPKNSPQTVFFFFFFCLKCLNTSMVCLCICISDNGLRESALKDSLFVSGANSLGVQTFAPSSSVLTPSTPFVHFIFHACSFTPLPLHGTHPRQPQPASCCFPQCPPFPFSFSILLSGASANQEHSAARADISEVTHTFMFQAPMTVTDMYIMLSESVRHASSLPLFIWKLFNVSGLCVAETYSGSFLYHDSHFAGVDTLLHMNIKHSLHLNSRNLAKALIQRDTQKASSMRGCQCLAVANFRLS